MSDINLVGFRPVTPEYTRINCVQLASINTRVSLCMFSRGGHRTARHCVDQYTVFFGYCSARATLLCWACYALGFATHFYSFKSSKKVLV